MSTPARSLSNPPDHYSTLNTKQRRNWRRTTRKIERNEQLRSRYPPYWPTSLITTTHIHHKTEIRTIHTLIEQAKATRLFVVDTESRIHQHRNDGALVQIQMVHSKNNSTVILIETHYLPEEESFLLERIKQLWSTIFDAKNEIITWGPLIKELENFSQWQWMNTGNAKNANLQSRFREWHDGNDLTHPVTESRARETGGSIVITIETPSDYSEGEEPMASYDEPDNTWSLQSAVTTALGKFLDKSMTINNWACGLDRELGTGKEKLFSKHRYHAEQEQDRRSTMIDYAVHDCTTVAELYFRMYPEKPVETILNESATPISIDQRVNDHYELSDISEDELIEFRRPKFNRPDPASPKTNPKEEPATTKKPSKSEIQKRKNLKRKIKQRTRPDYQNKLTRPLYYRYDVRKVRAQLIDDDLHHTHQITINRHRDEVRIGFKSKEELERARLIIRSNYFGRDQYIRRWSGK